MKMEFSGRLTLFAHITESARPMAHAVAGFDGMEDTFYATLDCWSQMDYLAQWRVALDQMRARCQTVVLVKGVHPPAIASFAEAYVGRRQGDRYVFVERPLDIPAAFVLRPQSPWHELAGASETTSDGKTVHDRWTVSDDE